MAKKELQILNKFLDHQEKLDKELLFGVYKDKMRNKNSVQLLLWIGSTECFSDFVIEVPEEVIDTVEPTTESAYYAGQRLIIVKINFNDEKLKNFLSPKELFRQIIQNQMIFDSALLPSEINDGLSIKGINQTTGRGLGQHQNKSLLTRPII